VDSSQLQVFHEQAHGLTVFVTNRSTVSVAGIGNRKAQCLQTIVGNSIRHFLISGERGHDQVEAAVQVFGRDG
jgi:hypothetical protein